MEKRRNMATYIAIITCYVLSFTTIVMSFPNNWLPHNTRSDPVVDTECGKVQGRSTVVTTDSGKRQTVSEFVNIPYAAPPTGRLRWRAPVSLKDNHSCWNGTLKYTEEIIKCVQITAPLQPVQGTEDCLILSVRTPSAIKRKNLPVLVWIHGGGMMFLNSRIKGFYPDNQFTASMEMVTVSINYRLNIFGFLSLEELWEEGPSGGYGNYGIMDQILALKWVKKNIRNFGGNPNDVTIFGESGGGAAVYCLLSASLGIAKGLFQKVIASSGTPNIRTTHTEANKIYRPFVTKTNCTHGDRRARQKCLRSLDPTTVILNSGLNDPHVGALDFNWKFPFNRPVRGLPVQILDPLVVKYSPTDLLSHLHSLPHEHKLDILLGNMAQDIISLTLPKLDWFSWAAVKNYLEPRVRSFNNCSYTDLLELYQKRSPNKFTPSDITPFYAYTVMTTDLLTSCATTELAYNLTRYSHFKVYSYIVSQSLSVHPFIYAEHSHDVVALFNFYFLQMFYPSYIPTAEDEALKTNLRFKLKEFVYSSKRFETMHRNRTMEFWNSTTVHTWERPYHEEECKFLRKYGFLKHSWGNQGIWNN